MTEQKRCSCCNASLPCGCCAGTEAVTPLPVVNRPGLDAIAYRVGTHATFLETMKARLANLCLDSDHGETCKKGEGNYPLQKLTTRAANDPSIALLDAWATVSDVLTFYQERIANEGYLRTATERRSILELARLVGYQLRPGVAATTYLALKLEDKHDVVIEPLQLRAQSIPGPGELPQAFENSETLDARARWNKLQPRMTQPQRLADLPEKANSVDGAKLYLKGIATGLNKNDPLLIVIGDTPDLYRVIEVTADVVANRTQVTIQPWLPATVAPNVIQPDSSLANFATLATNTEFDELRAVMPGLTKRASVPPANALRLDRTAAQAFAKRSDLGIQAFGALRPLQRETITPALANATVTLANQIAVYTLRVKAAPFGHNTPKKVLSISREGRILETGEWPIVVFEQGEIEGGLKQISLETEKAIYLDAVYDKIVSGSWVVIDTSAVTQSANMQPLVTPVEKEILITKVGRVQPRISRGEYGISGTVTHLTLDKGWIRITQDVTAVEDQKNVDQDFKVIRETTILAQSEQLELAEAPIDEPICNPTDDTWTQLDGVYSELKSGRWVVVAGERDDIKDSADKTVEGVKASELVMLADVVHEFDPTLPGDTTHTRIKFARKLEYCYQRDKVTIYANVVKATHGETRREVLGSGDGSKALQRFALRQPPLTYVSSLIPAGAESTLKLFVNNVQWHETDSLFGLVPSARRFITQTSDDAVTTAIFGNGEKGARLPTGAENVRAEYRQGIGKVGNVKAEQISLLVSRPLGVKEVINPLRAAGGADKENRDQARKNAPLAILALDRLVSTQDYSDFARTFAGVGKAFATRLSDGRRELVHVTIAGVDDVPIDETSDLFRNLGRALRQFGDPAVPVTLAVRELMLLFISANVRLLSDYQWEPVARQIRSQLLDTFSFEQRDLGQDVMLSQVISTIQGVTGVAYIDVDEFGGVAEKNDDGTVRTPKQLLDAAQKLLRDKVRTPEQLLDATQKVIRDKLNQRVRVNLPELNGSVICPAQLAYLAPDVQDTLILNLI